MGWWRGDSPHGDARSSHARRRQRDASEEPGPATRKPSWNEAGNESHAHSVPAEAPTRVSYSFLLFPTSSGNGSAGPRCRPQRNCLNRGGRLPKRFDSDSVLRSLCLEGLALENIAPFQSFVSAIADPIDEILLLSLCGVISGRESFVDIVAYGEEKLRFLRKLAPFEHGMLSVVFRV